MLNINMEGIRDYAQHMQLSFHVFHIFSLNTKVSTRVLQIPSLNKNHQSLQVLHSFLLNTNHQSLKCSRTPCSRKTISSIMCFRVYAQHKQPYTYINNNWLTPNIYKTNHDVHMQWGLRPNRKLKHQDNHHN